MPRYIDRLKILPFAYGRLVRIVKWSPLLITIVLLGKWTALFGGAGGWSVFESGFDGDHQLTLNLKMTLMGLALLGAMTWWNIGPRWLSLIRPAVAMGLPVATAILLIAFGSAFAVNPDVLHSEFRPINPFEQPQSWLVAMATLLLGALQQEIWGRALLQSTLQRMFGNRWVALFAAALMLSLAQGSNRPATFCSAILFGVAFIRTRSVICTTLIHATLDLSVACLQGGPLIASSLLDPAGFRAAKPLLFIGFLLLALAVELWCRRNSRGPDRVKTFAKNLLLIVAALTFCLLFGKLVWPVWPALAQKYAWLSPYLRTRAELVLQAGVTVAVLAWLHRGPPLRTLFAPRPAAALGVSLAAAMLPALAAAIAAPGEFWAAHLALPAPYAADPGLLTGVVLTIVVGAFAEEMFCRALLQPLLSRLFFSQWVGAVAGALLFTSMHTIGNEAFIFPGGLLLSIVFMRTQSIVCTTLLHVALNVSLTLTRGTTFMESAYMSTEAFDPARPVYGVLLVALTIAFEWCWRRSERARTGRLAPPPNERIPGFDPASLSP